MVSCCFPSGFVRAPGNLARSGMWGVAPENQLERNKRS